MVHREWKYKRTVVQGANNESSDSFLTFVKKCDGIEAKEKRVKSCVIILKVKCPTVFFLSAAKMQPFCCEGVNKYV